MIITISFSFFFSVPLWLDLSERPRLIVPASSYCTVHRLGPTATHGEQPHGGQEDRADCGEAESRPEVLTGFQRTFPATPI